MELHGNIIIVGGGLSGLTLAYLLKQSDIEAIILEASPRLGGRIQTVKGILETPLELGATWFSDLHSNLFDLLDELNLKKYPQYSKGVSLFQTKSFEPAQEFFVPEAESSSYRIVGGTQVLIDTLAQKLSKQSVYLNAQVVAIKEENNELVFDLVDGSRCRANKAVVCLPPQLAASKIQFLPELPNSIRSVLPTVQTWMSGAIKFTIEYAEPFWRNKGYSGMLYSHAGIITEMYDHCNFEEDKFGLTGFLNGGASAYSQEVRKELILRQLADLLDERALIPSAYYDKVWTDEFVIDGNPIIYRPHQNNGHQSLQNTYMNGKLLFCGTETATEFAGYMEGAVIAANRVFESFKEKAFY